MSTRLVSRPRDSRHRSRSAPAATHLASRAIGTLAVAVITIGTLWLSTASLEAQRPSLAEVARKEAERRSAAEAAAKVYTTKDLPAGAQEREPSPAEGNQPVSSPAPAAAAAQKPVRDEAWWKARIVQAREELRRNEALADALQTRINALARDFVSRDNPVQRAGIGEERAEALDELARVRQEIERGKKQIEDIAEEARQAGVPPGWLR